MRVFLMVVGLLLLSCLVGYLVWPWVPADLLAPFSPPGIWDYLTLGGFLVVVAFNLIASLTMYLTQRGLR